MIQSIGLSVYTNEQFEIALNAPLDVIQIPFNVLDNGWKEEHLFAWPIRKIKKYKFGLFFYKAYFFREFTSKIRKIKIPLKEVMACQKNGIFQLLSF